MSNSYLTRRVHCGNDCRQAGCPGHELTLHHAHTSDTVAVILDGQHYATFDNVIWRTLVNMEEESRHPDDVRARGDGLLKDVQP